MDAKPCNLTVANLTLHAVSPEMVAWGQGKWANADPISGMALTGTPRNIVCGEPHGISIDPGEDSLGVAQRAIQSVWDAKAEGANAILVGGLSDVAYYQIAAAHDIGLPVYVAETERVRDEHDRFVFRFLGLRPVRDAAILLGMDDPE